MIRNYNGLSALAPVAQQAEDFVQKKNIPPDQVVPFLLSLRMPGLAGAVAQKMRLDQAGQMMKQMQGNPPSAPPTVVQENQAKLQNAEAMLGQGMGAMPAGVMDRAQFQGGITGEPLTIPRTAQTPQAPQRMADGGFLVAPKPSSNNPQNPLGDYTPDPAVQRQINDQAGLGEMSEADKFRFYGMPMEPGQRASDSDAFKYALRNVATDPAAIGAGIGAIVGGPLGIPVGGYLGRMIPKPTGMAGGGPVAFQAGGVPQATAADIFGDAAASAPGVRQAVAGDFEAILSNPAVRQAVEADFGMAAERVPPSALRQWAAKNLPTFGRYAAQAGEAGIGGIARGAARVLGKGAAAVGVPYEVGSSLYKTARAEPGYVAEEYGFDPNSKIGKSVAGGLSYLENVANIPTLGLYGALRGPTPQERALERTEKETKKIGDTSQFEQNEYINLMQQKRSPDQIAAIGEYQTAVRNYGANSPQARAAEEKYKNARGTGGVSDQQALADYIARSAKSGKEEKLGKPTLGPAPAFYDVTKDTGVKAIDEQLKGVQDVTKADIAKKVKDEEFQDKMKFYEDQGITKPIMDAQTRLKTRRDQLELAKDKDFGKALAIMGFTMMKTKGNFLAALGEGGAASLAALETFEEKRQNALDKLDTQQLLIDQQLAGLKEKAGAAAEARVDKLEARRNQLEDRRSALIEDGNKLRRTEAFQWAMQERTFAANIDAIDRRYGGNYERQIEKDIITYRNVLNSDAPANVKAEAKRKLDALQKEREAATQGGSAAYQSALLKQMAQQALLGGAVPGGAAGASTGGIDDLVAKYAR